jgi:predicted lipoprotein with Yx(FWY)xxD motif
MRIRTTLATSAGLLLLLAGCGAADSGSSTAADTPTATQDDGGAYDDGAGSDDSGTDDDNGSATDDDTAAVMVASTSLGDVLVDADGMTLYMYDPDQQGPSTCYDACATAWPPLLTEGDLGAGDGADDSLLGTVERDDGGQQVTYDGWPLYYYAQDSAAGDVNGQGANEVWWVLDADGTPIHG